jgi:hypothetical protein
MRTLSRRQEVRRSPPDETVDFLAGASFCHPDQVSEAQAVAKARRDRREAMCLKTPGKKKSLRVDPSAPLAKKCERRSG